MERYIACNRLRINLKIFPITSERGHNLNVKHAGDGSPRTTQKCLKETTRDRVVS